MLKKIILDLSSAVAKSQSVQSFLHILEHSEIDCLLHPNETLTPAYFSAPFSGAITTNDGLFSENILVITNTASSVSSARTAHLPCIGFAPPGHSEDLSGAYALFEDFASIDIGYLCRTHAHAMGYPAEILTTDRLTVRELSEEDFPALYSMCTAPETAPFMEEKLSDYKKEQEKHSAYLRNVYPFFDLALWGVYEKTSGTLMGRAGFSLPEDDTDTFLLGYLIDVPYRKQGYAKELLPALLSYAKEQGYSKVSAKIKRDNIASQRTLANCGYPYDCKDTPQQKVYTYTIYLTM